MKKIDQEYIPYDYSHAPVPGGGFVTGFCYHTKVKNILYARTDIGGVYRYDCINMNWMGETAFFDATHPGARQFVWDRCKENYFDKGIKIFWFDEAEPEFGPYDFDIYRYYQGPALQCSNIYPAMYSKAYFDGMKSEGMDKIVNLVRCAWAVFCPVTRLHGERVPFYPLKEEFRNGVRQFSSGQDNEVWSYGKDNLELFSDYLFMRERLRPYTRKLMEEAHEKGLPVMRTMFFEFPDDKVCWDLTDQYMFGSEILVAPVMEEGIRSRSVYLPVGNTWKNATTGEEFTGGQTVIVDAPLEVIPIFTKEGFDINILK